MKSQPVRLTHALNEYRDLTGFEQGDLTFRRYIGLRNGVHVWWADCTGGRKGCTGGRYMSAQDDVGTGRPLSCGCRRTAAAMAAGIASMVSRKGAQA